MAKTMKFLSVGSMITLMVIMLLPTYTSAATIPDWIPKPEQIEDYDMLWNGTEEMANIFDLDSEANITFYNQLWYKNDTSNNTLGMVSASFVDIGSNIWEENPRPSSCGSYFDESFPDFKGNTRWQFFVYLLNESIAYGQIAEIQLSGYDHVVEANCSNSFFNYFIIGAIGSRLVITFAFDLEYYNDWFSVLGADIGVVINFAVIAFVGGVAAITGIFESLCQLASLIPTASANYTSSEFVKNFVASVATIIAPSGGIPGYPVAIVGLLSFITVAIIIKKKQH